MHHALGQRAGGRRFHHCLVLRSGHWSQNTHYRSIQTQFTLRSKSWLNILFHVMLNGFQTVRGGNFVLGQDPAVNYLSDEHHPSLYYLDKQNGSSTYLEY